MKLTDILDSSFPDNEGYRLVDVYKIEPKNKSFHLLLTFQKIEKARIKYGGIDSYMRNSLRKFPSSDSILRIANISYARFFVVGSIWWNEGEPQGVLPDYLTKFSINSEQINWNSAKSYSSSKFAETQSMGIKYNNRKGILTERYPKVLCYELNESLFQQTKKNNIAPLISGEQTWESQLKVDFIAFHTYEIFRYFFTSLSITDLNERLCSFQFGENSDNQLYNEENSKKIDSNNFVHLKKEYDQQDVNLLGNIIYLPKFKETISKIQSRLNVENYYYFHFINFFPAEGFDSMNFTATKVIRSSDNAVGLLILQLHSCKGYTNLAYTPIVPLSKSDGKTPSSSNSKRIINGGIKPGVVPVVQNRETTSMHSTNLEIDFNQFFKNDELSNDINILDPFYSIENGAGGYTIIDNDENIISPPSSFPEDKNGRRITNKIDVEPTIYFEFFTEIITKLTQTLNKRGLFADVDYLNENLIFDSTETIIKCENIKTKIKDEHSANWFTYVVRLRILHQGVYKYYHVFEKYSNKYSSSRTWLYSFPSFKESNEINLMEKINNFLNKNSSSNPGNLEPDERFNHLSSNKTGDKKYEKVKREDAINKHVEKLSNRILISLNLKPIKLLQTAKKTDI